MHFQWIALRYFRETVQTRSIRKAADQLNIAPSAINRQILKLEEQLKSPLFERSSKGLKLTAAGEVFYRYVLKTHADLDRAIADVDDLRSARRGHVVVACEEGIAKDFLPAVIGAFRAQHRHVSFGVHVRDMQTVVSDVAEGLADLGIAFSPSSEPCIRRRRETAVAIGAVVHPSHLLADCASIKLTDLIGETLIVPDNGFSTRRLFNAQLGGDAELVIGRQLETNSFETMTALIKAGVGVGIRSRVGIAGEIGRGEVAFVPFEERSFPRETVAAIVKRNRILPVAGACFAEAVDDALSQLGDERLQADQPDTISVLPSLAG
ncbi:LysR family transcriptional regulator [Lichenifustis flavocetrariae]|uniref:LysR family transcriptional regulator n=1 Tax=Lichenifustis flavocetrariae TaxID=2949735 RepID=A0AA41YSP2_9HYPH|nr:LysR family transcriptional regulator [Lichenifustis flavocetrariae]MCW6507434.1 LysR family transcriptional regulator [Lichenifustis flavocetrariae]